MKTVSLILFLQLAGCSSIDHRLNYVLHEPSVSDQTSSWRRICTVWNATDGAAFSTISGSQVLVKAPVHIQTIFWGPLLVPIIPVSHQDREFVPYVEIQIVPASEQTMKFPLQEVKILSDDDEVSIEKANYSIRGTRNQELTQGILEKDQLHSNINIVSPYSVTLSGKSSTKKPKVLTVSFVLANESNSERRIVQFRQSETTKYKPFLFPGMETDERCQNPIIEGERTRNLF